MDAAYYLPSRGGKKELWLQENKTKGQVDMYMIQNTLNQDLQTMIYSYALAHLKGPVSGVLYNVIRRAQLRIRVNESHKDFIARVGDDIEKRPDFYFIRWSTPITPQDVEAFLTRQLDPILEAIYDWWESIKHNPFDPWVNASGGVNLLHYQRPFGVYDPMGVRGSGSFFQMLTQGSYAGLEQRENPFAELTEANTPKEV
jgi:hypothetical protein